MRILITGATSAIAQAAARLWAARGEELHLVGRNPARLEAVAADLRVRGAKAVTVSGEIPDLEVETVLIAQGVLDGTPDEVLRVNLLEPVRTIEELLPRLKPGARIAALSSVAGDRGRGVNPVYGASKAGLDAYLSGLRQRLTKQGIAVVTLKPGFVDTPMTAGMRKNPLFASPERVGRGIVRAIDRGDAVVYLPWWWRLVMLAVRSIPERLFRRLSF